MTPRWLLCTGSGRLLCSGARCSGSSSVVVQGVVEVSSVVVQGVEVLLSSCWHGVVDVPR